MTDREMRAAKAFMGVFLEKMGETPDQVALVVANMDTQPKECAAVQAGLDAALAVLSPAVQDPAALDFRTVA